ncbi:UDP-glycosyltransferase CGT-like [Salvia miltiorrhiza]|uniref:UDP-glycosyltransferase CGT-like n=1 Tax=Salvia miltiorrhiza TaxID=226208 RepID=UPI0025ABB874|nr:UDP-glycosyltransferase CGT-like [Salvia miltiorrhiza]
MSVSDERDRPHLVFLPSGIGNSALLFRLAAAMASRNCRVTFINVHPPQPAFPNQPGVEVLDFEMLAVADTASLDDGDPFIARAAAINRAFRQLNPILTSLQASAIFSDFAVAATLADLNIPLFIVSTTSAKFLALVANTPRLLSRDPDAFSNCAGEIQVQLGMPSIPKASIPAAWLHKSSSNNLLTAYLLPNARALSRVRGVVFNTFDWFEQETLAVAALDSSRPPLFPVGPLPTHQQQGGHQYHLPWLREQPAKSVVYVNFGSQLEVISQDQIGEVRKGLEICGYGYLWAMAEGEPCFERRGKGVIARGGVDQERVLADPAIGVFVNQCEWQSIMQAAWEGVPVLAWPQHGDQRMNAEAVEKTGLGMWMKEWSRGGEGAVDGDEIGRVVRQMMEDLNINKAAEIVRERAREAASENGGSSQKAFHKLMHMFTSNNNYS